MPNAPKLSAHVKRAVAVEAKVDPRTIDRFMAGERVQPMNGDRVRAALVALGLPLPGASR